MYIKYYVTFILILLLALSSGSAQAQEQKAQEKNVRLYIPDGQLIDRPVRVYVLGIEDSQLVDPRLRLISLKHLAKLKRDVTEISDEEWRALGLEKKPFDRAEGQLFKREVRGSWEKEPADELDAKGIVLLFDLRKLPIRKYWPGTRILPKLIYGNKQSVLADREVYICHRSGTIFIVLIIVVPLILILNFLAKKDNYLKGLLSTADGRMSVSLTQMFLWTVAVGAAVLALGITRLSIPEIHESLVILMGLSVTTSMVGHWQSDSVQEEKRRRREEVVLENDKEQKNGRKPKLSDLVMIKVPGGEDADLVKAQLLFWTVITLSIFVIKSIIEGELWDVPPQLLTLMGISQAGFLTRKQFILHQEKKVTANKVASDKAEAERKAAAKKATAEK